MLGLVGREWRIRIDKLKHILYEKARPGTLRWGQMVFEVHKEECDIKDMRRFSLAKTIPRVLLIEVIQIAFPQPCLARDFRRQRETNICCPLQNVARHHIIWRVGIDPISFLERRNIKWVAG